MNEIFGVIEEALEKAGYKILEGDRDHVYVLNPKTKIDYEIKIEALDDK